MVDLIRRGEVWVASFRPWRGQEVGKIRPCLILQADWLTAESVATVVALPLTSQLRQGADALRIEVPARDRLTRPSWIMTEKLRALDRSRFGDGPLTRLNEFEMAAVERAVRAVLGLN